MISEENYDKLLNYFSSHFHSFLTSKEKVFKKIILCITCLKYFRYLKELNYDKAYDTLSQLDESYWSLSSTSQLKHISISLYDQDNKINDFTVDELSSLLCYNDVANSEFKFFFTENQVNIISNQINSLILEIAGLNSESILEIAVKQHMLSNYLNKALKNSFGEKLSIKL